ncbi:MAG: electron transfer flavoprotein subunit alpha/FixB family protein [Candidatus Saccharibacteria bacterium]
MGSLIAFLNLENGRLTSGSPDLIRISRQIADKIGANLHCICPVQPGSEDFERLKASGTDRVTVITGIDLSQYKSELYLHALSSICRSWRPEVVLFEADRRARELAPALAAVLGTGCSADCQELEVDEQGQLLQIVPAFAGDTMVEIITPEKRPVICTVKTGSICWPVESEHLCEIDYFHAEPVISRIEVLSIEEKKLESASLVNAEIVVAGGAGVGKASWHYLQELADLLGGAVGATRPAVDEGWAEESQMIGQSGISVSPKIYLALGVSGDIQHVVGIKGADLVVAVNRDPRAKIFDNADIGIMDDVNEFLPELLRSVADLKEG